MVLLLLVRYTFLHEKNLQNIFHESSRMVYGTLEEEDYYHGLLPREDIPHLLIEEGDFLVRCSETAPNQPRQIIISILVEKLGGIVRITEDNFTCLIIIRS